MWTGLGEKEARDAGFDVETVIAVSDDKAHYYPGSNPFIMKLICDKASHKLLGIQVLGKGAVDKITDIAVTAISLGACLEDLQYCDYAYAPPFSTAIHPFETAVNIMLNKLCGDYVTMTPAEFNDGKAEGWRIIDTSQIPALNGETYVDLTQVNGDVPGLGKDEKLLWSATKAAGRICFKTALNTLDIRIQRFWKAARHSTALFWKIKKAIIYQEE